MSRPRESCYASSASGSLDPGPFLKLPAAVRWRTRPEQENARRRTHRATARAHHTGDNTSASDAVVTEHDPPGVGAGATVSSRRCDNTFLTRSLDLPYAYPAIRIKHYCTWSAPRTEARKCGLPCGSKLSAPPRTVDHHLFAPTGLSQPIVSIYDLPPAAIPARLRSRELDARPAR